MFAEEEAALLVAAGGDVEASVRRREAGEPLEVILGWVAFAGLRILIDPGVFVPRRRSEYLAALAVKRTPERGAMLDLCCGAGAIGAAVRAARSDAQVVACDIEPAAVACARRNLPVVFAGDLFAALSDDLRGRFDVIAANAPYVPSDEVALLPREAREHEPLVTLDGGHDGVELHRRIAADAADWLAPGGVLLIETGRDQAPLTVAALAAHGFSTRVRTKQRSTVVEASSAT